MFRASQDFIAARHPPWQGMETADFRAGSSVREDAGVEWTGKMEDYVGSRSFEPGKKYSLSSSSSFFSSVTFVGNPRPLDILDH